MTGQRHYPQRPAGVTLSDGTLSRAARAATENKRLREVNAELVKALRSAQATLNPASGFLKQGSPKRRKHVETVRDNIRTAIAKATADDT